MKILITIWKGEKSIASQVFYSWVDANAYIARHHAIEKMYHYPPGLVTYTCQAIF